jgi:uncharacterized protein YyaL (SSP411 family)
MAANLSRAFTYRPSDEPQASLLDHAYDLSWQEFDSRHGGFGSAPKFPSPHRLLFLLRCHHRTGEVKALKMVEKTLTAMRLGGIWDHVGFGFHRYSTDQKWLLPHFEKMLYDQALSAQAYLEAYQVTRNPLYAKTAEEIFTYVLRDMTSPEGAFFSAEDADSEGEEGKFYVWDLKHFREALGESPAEPWETIFGLTAEGNFTDEATGQKTGTNILRLIKTLDETAPSLNLTVDDLAARWEAARSKLFEVRKTRIPPLKDDKILTDWNGLMIAALAMGARVLHRKIYTQAAEQAVKFIFDQMRDSSGRLYHRFRDGEAAIEAHADDYAFFINGLLNLYQATFDLTYAEEAAALQEDMLTDFWDNEQGGFFSTPTGRDELPVRPKELYDGAIPSANSVSLLNLLWLSRLSGDPKWEQRAHSLIRAFSGTIKSQPVNFTYFLAGLDFALHPGQEVVIAGEPDTDNARKLLSALNLNFAPHKVALVKSGQNAERLARFAGFTDGLQLIKGRTTAHVCKNFSCKEPTEDAHTMLKRIIGKK